MLFLCMWLCYLCWVGVFVLFGLVFVVLIIVYVLCDGVFVIEFGVGIGVFMCVLFVCGVVSDWLVFVEVDFVFVNVLWY